MNPEHMAAAHELLASVDYGSIAAAELLATQLAEVDRLTRELAAEKSAHSDERAAREHAWDTLGKRTAELAERTRERDAYRDALALVAKGHISPSFAGRVLKGEPPLEALDAEIKAARLRR